MAGGMAPARTYIPELLADVLAGTINPGRVFDVEMPLEEAPEAYRAMDERRAIKVLLDAISRRRRRPVLRCCTPCTAGPGLA